MKILLTIALIFAMNLFTLALIRAEKDNYPHE